MVMPGCVARASIRALSERIDSATGTATATTSDDDRGQRQHSVPTEPAEDSLHVVADDTTCPVDMVDGLDDVVVVLDELDHRHLAALRHATGRYLHARRRRHVPPGDLTGVMSRGLTCR